MSEAERLAERLEHALRMYELPRGVCIDIRQAAALIRAQSARMAAIEEALRPFAGMRKSTEPEVSDLLNRSPSEQLRDKQNSPSAEIERLTTHVWHWARGASDGTLYPQIAGDKSHHL